MRAQSKYANAEAVTFFDRAAEAARRSGEASAQELAGVLESLGDVRTLVGSIDAAADAYRQARRLVAADPAHVAQIMLKVARIEQRHGQFAISMRRLTRAMTLMSSVEGEHAAAIRSLIATRYAICRFSQSRHAEALRWGELAVREGQDSMDKESLAQAYLAMQTVHLWAGKAEDLPYGLLALKAYEELDDLAGQAQSLNNLGTRAFFEGRWAEALALFRRSADSFRRLGDVVNEGTAVYNEADVLIRQGHLTQAEPLLLEASRAARAVDDAELFAMVERETGRHSRGRVDTSRRCHC